MFVRNKNNFNPILRKDFERFLTNILRVGYFYLYNIIMNEVFKSIKDFPNYEISNLGNVKSLNYHRCKTAKILIQNKDSSGYLYVGLYKQGRLKNMWVHRLIATHFISNPKEYPQVNHKDGNKLNNRIDNLEWCSLLENMQHAHNSGLINIKGENHYHAKLNNEKVLQIRKLHKTGKYIYKDLAKIYNCNNTTIGYIIRRQSWKHI